MARASRVFSRGLEALRGINWRESSGYGLAQFATRAAFVVGATFSCAVAGCARQAPPATQPSAVIPATQPYVLHLPGIGGRMWLDDSLINGLRDGGVSGEFEIYDWTQIDRGLPALGNRGRHDAEAQKIAEMITRRYRAHPGSPITLTSHSAGCGLAAWALEKLPDDVQVDTLLMMQSALSPEYDLSSALRKVKGRAYSFYSPHDDVLNWGTRGFGTVDRVFTSAAGRVSYTCPTGADVLQYQKLMQIAYDSAWLRLGNIGDHIGPMRRRFAGQVVAPLLLSGVLPGVSDRPIVPE